jgi:regulator of sirC expression with transglutaminase-like and TPR domain
LAANAREFTHIKKALPMRTRSVAWGVLAIVALLAPPLPGDEPAAKTPAGAGQPAQNSAAQADESVEQLTERARKSVVVITQTGRDGRRVGLGAGFIVSADGLIVTNFHVIGEGRPITVELADERRFKVTAIHASDRALDLAVVRIDAHDLPALMLGDSAALKQGQGVLAIGNPLGLKHSVVTGVVSGVREIEGRPMVQLAMPIEPGNSGGPLLDLQGRAQGILTLKSLLTANLGFAVGVNTLKPLLEKPNPIAMSRWLTIGALDPRQWQPLFGARWRQRAGRILVDGLGQGFGGRSLCLYQQPLPAAPFEIAVNVKLDDEAGAAGLVFGSDGEHKHFGFYPTNGKLRFTRFDGPDVFSWSVLEEQTSRHYRPGQWNQLRVRISADKIACFVNDQLVVESTETVRPDTKVGLAKFRDTAAEFKNFRVGEKLASEAIPAEQLQAVRERIDAFAATEKHQEAIEALSPQAAAAAVLRDRAKSLDEQAARLRRLAQNIHEHRVVTELAQALKGDEADVELFRAALLIAKLDNEELDVEPYLHEVRRMGEEIAGKLAGDASDEVKLAALRKYLFDENGFHGSRGDYYNRSNSYMNEVLDDREGLPITLSVLYMELAARLGVKVSGLGLPGHFIVQYVPAEGPPQLIDVYEGARPMSRDDAARRVRSIADRELADADLVPTTKRAIIVRMLHNLQGVAAGARDNAGLLRYLNAILAVDPESAQERWLRAVVSFQLDRKDISRLDAAWLLDKMPPGVDLERVRELEQLLER